MKRWMICAAAWIALSALLCLSACQRHTDEPPTDSRPTYDVERVSDYVRVDSYTDLSIFLERADSSKGEAVWQAVLQRSEVLSYPSAAVDYYVSQEREAVGHYAKQQKLSYEEALAELGLSEEEIDRRVKLISGAKNYVNSPYVLSVDEMYELYRKHFLKTEKEN